MGSCGVSFSKRNKQITNVKSCDHFFRISLGSGSNIWPPRRRENKEGDESIWNIIHVYIEMSQQNPCTTTINYQKIALRMKDRKVKQVLSGGRYQWERGKV
jgi:hypothetical protein